MFLLKKASSSISNIPLSVLSYIIRPAIAELVETNSADFYKGEEKNKEEVKILIPKARHLHLTGKESVAIGVEMDLVDPSKILYVNTIPHAEVVIEN